jgi:myo-inositol-1(or 4)-monophosphatase
MTSPQELLPTAVQATTIARELIRTRQPGALTTKGDRDYASDADYAAERAVRAFLAQATPSIGFLGEEEGASGNTGDLQWALDPIDGTVNFAREIPLCAVSLALLRGTRPVLGVIDLPFLGDQYTALEGRGAYCGGHRLQVSSVSTLHDAVVSIGDYAVGEAAEHKNAARLAVTNELARTALRVRMFGSAAIDLAWLAAGKTHATITLSNKPWDMAAGVLLAREAGATVVDLDGTEHSTQSQATIATIPALLRTVLELVHAAATG